MMKKIFMALAMGIMMLGMGTSAHAIGVGVKAGSLGFGAELGLTSLITSPPVWR